MADPEPLQTDTQPGLLPATEPYTVPPPSDDSLSFGESVKELWKAWTGSIGVKILSLAILVIIGLFIIFMITTSSYAASHSTCDTDLKKALAEFANCQSRASALGEQKRNIEGSIRQVKKEIDDLSGKNSDLTRDNEKLNTQIREQEPKIKDLKEQKEGKNGEITHLTKEVEELKTQKTGKEGEDKKAKEDLGKAEKELAEKSEEREKWTMGGTIAGGVNVLSLLSTGYFRWQLNVAQGEADAEEHKNRDLKGKIRNINSTIDFNRGAITRLKGQIISINSTITSCEQRLPEDKKVVQNCLDEEAKLHIRAGVLFDLGVDQAVYHHLSRLSNKHLKPELVFNSSVDGFNDTLLKERTAKICPILIVILSNENYAFGAYFNITFEHTGDVFKSDSLAFTFSTMQHAICKVRTPDQAIRFSGAHFLEIGNGEIQIDKSSGTTATGSATAGQSYDCHNAQKHTFYAENANFEVKEISVYHLQESHL